MLLLMDNTQIQELIKSYLDDVSDLDVSGRDCNFSIKIVSLAANQYFFDRSNVFYL